MSQIIAPRGFTVPLFTPDMRRQIVTLAGRGLRYSYLVSPTVWKDAGGVWRQQENPYDGDLATAQRVLTQSGPVVVDSATAAELAVAGFGTIT